MTKEGVGRTGGRGGCMVEWTNTDQYHVHNLVQNP